MKKETAFLIYLYDMELELLSEQEAQRSWQVAEIREHFAELFGINKEVAELTEINDG